MTTNPKSTPGQMTMRKILYMIIPETGEVRFFLKNLSLKDQENEKRYIINPKITYENIFSKSGSRYSSFTESQLASNLNEN